MADNQIQAGIYARVSTELQTETNTIESQLAALKPRVALDGLLLCEQLQFIDLGYSGATLVRPGLERLRDLVVSPALSGGSPAVGDWRTRRAAGGLDRLYVHSPE